MPDRNTAIAEAAAGRRVDVTLDGEFRRLSEELHSLVTLNVSEEGMLFVTGERPPVGSLLDLKLALPGDGRRLAVVGRVKRVRGIGGGKYETSVEFVRSTVEDRRRLLESAQTALEPTEAGSTLRQSGQITT